METLETLFMEGIRHRAKKRFEYRLELRKRNAADEKKPLESLIERWKERLSK